MELVERLSSSPFLLSLLLWLAESSLLKMIIELQEFLTLWVILQFFEFEIQLTFLIIFNFRAIIINFKMLLKLKENSWVLAVRYQQSSSSHYYLDWILVSCLRQTLPLLFQIEIFALVSMLAIEISCARIKMGH